MRVLFLFLDGIGLGENDPAVNPFAQAKMPNLNALLGGRTLLKEDAPFVGKKATLLAIDPAVGVAGLPQSATGQAMLLTGVNIPAATTQNDTFFGLIDTESSTSDTTATAADHLDGGAGTDTLNITVIVLIAAALVWARPNRWVTGWLIASMLAVGVAMERTGTAGYLARGIVNIAGRAQSLLRRG